MKTETQHYAWIGAVFLICMWIIWTTEECECGLRGNLR